MKNSVLIVLTYIILLSSLWSCSKERLIPDEKLQAIITEAIISDAIMNKEEWRMARDMDTRSDSIDIYAPILRKYGYTLADFKYSVNTLAMRKSNPLDNIFDNVVKQIDAYDATARYRYEKLLKFDTLALNYYADTIFTQHDTIRGSLENLKIKIYPALEGEYRIKFDYTSLTDERVGTKNFFYDAPSKRNYKMMNTYWLNKSKGLHHAFYRFALMAQYDTLKFAFTDLLISNEIEIIDTTFLASMQIIYFPPVKQARLDYFYKMTGLFPSIKEYYEDKFLPKTDRVTIPFTVPERPKTQRGGELRQLWRDIER